jgi:hypothetical protein
MTSRTRTTTRTRTIKQGKDQSFANEESHRWNSGGFEWGKESEDEKDDDEDDWKTRLVARAVVLICKINGIITISMIR